MLRYKNNGDTMFLVAENIAGQLGTDWGSPEDQVLEGNYNMMFDDAESSINLIQNNTNLDLWYCQKSPR